MESKPMSSDVKPTWEYDIPIEVVRWFKHNDVKVIYHVRDVDNYNMKAVVTYSFEDTYTQCFLEDVDPKWFKKEFINKDAYLTFDITSSSGLVKVHEELTQRMDYIDTWEKKHKEEFELYLKLKYKFEKGD